MREPPGCRESPGEEKLSMSPPGQSDNLSSPTVDTKYILKMAKCQKPCLACGSAAPTKAPPMDRKILMEAQKKHENKKNKKLQDTKPPVSFVAAALTTFKSSKKRRIAVSARSNIPD